MFDLLIVAYIGLNIYLGYRYGMFRRIMHIGAFFLGLQLAQALSIGFSQLMGYNTSPYPVSAHLLLYIGTIFAVVVFVEVLGFAYASTLRFMSGMLFDRSLGVVAGAVGAVFEVSILVVVILAAASTTGPSGSAQLLVVTTSAEQLTGSPTAKLIARVEPYAKFVYTPVLPADLSTYFTRTFT
ncbi:MAG: hypothetical protein QOE92_132 [Chloroflexota bacterium]|nr:hypothetical protein [Chloroflexota bacterium]